MQPKILFLMHNSNQDIPNCPSLSSSRVSSRSNRSRGITLITSQLSMPSNMEQVLQEQVFGKPKVTGLDNLQINQSDPHFRRECRLSKEPNIFKSDKRSPQETTNVFNHLNSSIGSGSIIGKRSQMGNTYRIEDERPQYLLNEPQQKTSSKIYLNQDRIMLQRSLMHEQTNEQIYPDWADIYTKPQSQSGEDCQKPPHKRPGPVQVSSPSVSSHSPSKQVKPEVNLLQQVVKRPSSTYKKVKPDGKYACACKKDMCLTDYCGCVKNGRKCADTCNCFTCLNYVGAPPSIIVKEKRKTSVFNHKHYGRSVFCGIAQILMPSCFGLDDKQSLNSVKQGGKEGSSSSCSEVGSFQFKFELPEFRMSISKTHQYNETEPATSRMDQE